MKNAVQKSSRPPGSNIPNNYFTTQVFHYLRANHRGRENVITVPRLTECFKELGATVRTIQAALRQLNCEGYPIVTFVDPPGGVCYAVTQGELDAYRANLISRLEALKERITWLERMRLEPEQMKLFS